MQNTRFKALFFFFLLFYKYNLEDEIREIKKSFGGI